MVSVMFGAKETILLGIEFKLTTIPASSVISIIEFESLIFDLSLHEYGIRHKIIHNVNSRIK